jgi:hypothetical protein
MAFKDRSPDAAAVTPDRQRLADARAALLATSADPRALVTDRIAATERALLELLRIAEAAR